MKPLHKDNSQLSPVKKSWLKHYPLSYTNTAKVMHRLPVRRNLELSDLLTDALGSLVLQAVLKRMLHNDLINETAS